MKVLKFIKGKKFYFGIGVAVVSILIVAGCSLSQSTQAASEAAVTPVVTANVVVAEGHQIGKSVV